MGEDSVTRKLAAVIYADVAGYSRLTGADEEATHRALSAALDAITIIIEGHGGRVLHYAGDAILAEFASVVVSLTAAIDIQRDLAARNHGLAEDRRLLFRIGVNLGDVIVDRDELYGDGVNVAARLESLADPGGICISRKVLHEVRDKLEVGFEFLGEQAVKNIENPIPVYRVLMDPEAAGKVVGEAHSGSRQKSSTAVAAVVAVVVLAVVAGSISWWQPWKSPPPPAPKHAESAPLSDKLSIVVLPFSNMSGEKEQEYFSDGMTEDLITDLSKLSGLLVIARNTSFTYKGRAVNVPAVAKELGVRYVLEGSVRASGGRVRINAQLIDSQTGGHLWAERFDRELGDIFSLQDDVTAKIVSALAVNITQGEKKLLGRTDQDTTPETYDVFLRGREALRRFTPEGVEASRDYFRKAIAMDPGYARAYAALGFSYSVGALFFRSDDSNELIEKSLKNARKAIKLDDTLPQGHFSMAVAYLRQGHHREAISSARQAVKHDPNYADGYGQIANVLAFAGEGAEAKRVIQKAMALNPRYSGAYIEVLSRAHFVMGEYDAAIKLLQECVSRDPSYLLCRMLLVSTYGLTGKIEEAEWEVEEVRNLSPNFSSRWKDMAFQFLKAEDKQRFVSGLRKAGLSED
ncbi:MAG: tetratricopeptide repeat protein [Rhodospirillales bacterium]